MILSRVSLTSLVVRGKATTATGRRAMGKAAGPSFEYMQPSADDPKLRKTCTSCGFVQYENPKVVCGSVLTVKAAGRRSVAASGSRADGRITGDGSDDLYVLGRRTIQPRRGFWGIPAGFLESGETCEEGAAREAREEVNADVAVGGLLAVYSLPHIDQIQMIYSSVLKNAQQMDGKQTASSVSAGQETDEVMLVRWDDIPWDTLAFPTTSWALWHHRVMTEEAGSNSFNGSREQPFMTTHRAKEGAASEIEADARQGHPSATRAVATGVSRAGSRVSHGRVFSTPSPNSSLFWCPDRGLHVKDGWNVSTDS